MSHNITACTKLIAGELRSGEVFDHEVKSSYTFTVIATDSQGSYAQAAVIVTVLDANDNEPLLDLSVYNFTIPENSAGGKCLLTYVVSLLHSYM